MGVQTKTYTFDKAEPTAPSAFKATAAPASPTSRFGMKKKATETYGLKGTSPEARKASP